MKYRFFLVSVVCSFVLFCFVVLFWLVFFSFSFPSLFLIMVVEGPATQRRRTRNPNLGHHPWVETSEHHCGVSAYHHFDLEVLSRTISWIWEIFLGSNRLPFYLSMTVQKFAFHINLHHYGCGMRGERERKGVGRGWKRVANTWTSNFLVKGALDKYNIIPKLFPQKFWFNDCMLSFMF